jgi:hypothetical protein
VKVSQNALPALFSAILFLLGALFVFAIALLMGMTALISLFAGTEIQAEQTIFLIGFGLEGIILLAAAFFSFQKFLQKPGMDEQVSLSATSWQIAVLMILAAVSILIGYLIRDMNTIRWLLLPLLTIPAAVFPLAALFVFGVRSLPLGTRWQTWNVLGLGMTLTPLLLLILEVVVALFILFGIVAYLLTQPELFLELQRLSQQIMILGPESEAALDLLSPFLTKPIVIIIALIYIGGIVPAIEEIFKPIGVWLFANKLDSPAQGFTLGALSGAAYALIETIGVSGQAEEWASLLFSRIGTGLLHITTSALMGTAIVLAWRERHYLRLLGTYFIVVLLHGLWNSFAILFTFSGLAAVLNQAGILSTIQPAIIVLMSILAVGLFFMLIFSNRRMRKIESRPLPELTVAGEKTGLDQTV